MLMDDFIEVDTSVFTRCLNCELLFLKSDKHKCESEVKPLTRWLHKILKEHNRPLDIPEICEIITKRSQLSCNYLNIRRILLKKRTIFKLTHNFVSLTDWKY